MEQNDREILESFRDGMKNLQKSFDSIGAGYRLLDRMLYRDFIYVFTIDGVPVAATDELTKVCEYVLSHHKISYETLKTENYTHILEDGSVLKMWKFLK